MDTFVDESGADVAIGVYRDEGQWQVERLPARVTSDPDTFVRVLRQLPGENGSLGILIVDEDFFVVVRIVGGDVRYLLSDVTAATDYPVANAVLEQLHLPVPEEDDKVQPAGDLGILADFGVEPMALAAICDDLDRYPDEVLADLAGQLGFGEQFDAIVADAVV